MTSIKRILFLTESREDYLADSILHGLISLEDCIDIKVIDYPCKDILYLGGINHKMNGKLSLRGNGFTLYGKLRPRNIDRSVIYQRLEAGYFDLVVVGQVWRQWGQLLDIAPLLQNVPVVLLDGDDDDRLFHRSGTRIRRYGIQPFPIRSGKCLYIKREWRGDTATPKYCKYISAGFSIPEHLIRESHLSYKTQTIASHCVDQSVAIAFGLKCSYAFSSEKSYYDDIYHSEFGITTRRGGWDCLRHYEIAAAGAVICFRDLHLKPRNSAPHGLIDGINCISYKTVDDLRSKVASLRIDQDKYHSILHRSHLWSKENTTIAVAKRILREAHKI